MNRKLGWIIGALALTGGASQAALLPYPEPVLKYPRYSEKDEVLKAAWSGWKTRFVVNGVIQGNDPAGNKKPISEGQSYGMLLAVWMNDEAAFNTIWNATEQTFWNSGSGWYKWAPGTGGGGDNFAGDADQDICAALIFASALADKGYWADKGYKAKAKTVLQAINKSFFDANGYVYSWPGNNSGLNPSYHMPAWHPIFKEFGDSNGISIDWSKRTSAAFALINAQTNSKFGMARNFSSSSGGPSGCGDCSSTPNRDDMGFDAIRVPYRMGTAALWYGDKMPQAVAWCTSVWANGAIDPKKPGMYTVDSKALWGWGTAPQYEEFTSRSMWAAAAIGVAGRDANAAAAFGQIANDFSAKHAVAGVNYLSGANNDETSAAHPSKNYYAQSLGLLGALVIFGRAWNVWDDLKHKWIPPDTAAAITAPLTTTPASIEQTPTGSVPSAAQTSTVTATLSKAVPWTLTFKGRTSGHTFSTTGNGTSVSFAFNSLKRPPGTTATFQVETCDVRLKYNGVDTVNSTKAKATITITQNTGIAARAVRGDGLVRWVEGGLELQDPAWMAGDRVTAKVMDLGGRTLQSADQTLVAATQGVRVSTSVGSSLSLRILELSNGANSRRYILSPNP